MSRVSVKKTAFEAAVVASLNARQSVEYLISQWVSFRLASCRDVDLRPDLDLELAAGLRTGRAPPREISESTKGAHHTEDPRDPDRNRRPHVCLAGGRR
ncbi:MAG: hypothetical protein ACRD3V_25955, partial [Vicinamibacteria bacterium]